MKKRNIAFIAIATLLALSGCNDNSASTSNSNSTSTSNSTSASNTGSTTTPSTSTSTSPSVKPSTSPSTSITYTFKEVITKEPTCTEKGVKSFICNEDASKNYEEEIPALDHKLGDPVRNEEGTKIVTSCERENCDYSISKDIVKVIVLAGQSNAVGHSYVKYFSEDVRNKYADGYPNIQINYDLSPFASETARHKSDGFTKVQMGQGRKASDGSVSFGPELGMAEYLNEHYPNEKFYIIKTAAGATTLHDHWYSPSLGKPMASDNLYNYLIKFVDESMNLIKENNENEYPEIISYCWMQGENDAKSYSDEYENNWSTHVADLKETWENSGYVTPNGLSIIDAGITNYWTNFNKINQIKEDYASKSSKNHFIYVADSNWVSTYKDNTDYAHLDASAMLELGHEFGKNVDLVIKDLKNKEITSETPVYEDGKWDGNTYSTSLSGTGTETDPYLIQSNNDMAFFAKEVKEGNTYEGKFVSLTADLNMSHANFTGIGDGDLVTVDKGDGTTSSKWELKEFKGTFDGNNHNVKLRISKPYVAGLFNASSGTIKNVSTSGTVFTTNRVCGGIVGYLNGGVVENVTNNANIAGRFYENGKGHIGGVVGLLKAGSLKNATNNGSVYGSVTKFADAQGTGGVIGTIESGAVEVNNLTNRGYVYGRGFNNGGVIGLVRKGGNFVLSKLYNYGTVVGKTNTGGIIGGLNFSNVTIEDVHNYGDIKGTNYVGGVIGAFGYDGNRTSTLQNATNEGKVIATTEDSKGGYRLGGIAGMAYGTTLKNCTNSGEVVAGDIVTEDVGTEENKRVGYIVGYKTASATIEECNNTFTK